MDGADLGSAQWTNVQDPVKQMITAITKAVRTQSAGIKDLDRRVEQAATNEVMETRLQEVMQMVSNQIEAQISPLQASLKKKADISDLSTLEKNTISMAKQLDKINELLHSQNNAILNLNERITRVTAEVEGFKEPLLEKMMRYVDQRTADLAQDVDRKLAAKTDQSRGSELAASSRHLSEEVIPSLIGQIAELKADMRDVATRSDLHILASTKANIADVNDLAVDIGQRPSRADAHQLVNAQIKPLVSAITAIEKAIHVQEININNSRLEMQKHRSATVTVPRPASPTRSLTREQVRDIVEEVFRDKVAERVFVTPGSLDGSISAQREAILDEVYSRQTGLKEDVSETCKELISSLKRHTDSRLTEIAGSAREARDLNNKAKGAVKELASNVAKALAKKVDKTDLKKMLKEHSYAGGKVSFREEPAVDATAPELLSRSHTQWAQSAAHTQGAPLTQSLLRTEPSRPSSSPDGGVNAESARNEEELKTQLELIQDHLFSLKAEMNALQRTVREKGSPSRSHGKRRTDDSSGDENRKNFINTESAAMAAAASDTTNGNSGREWRLAISELATGLRRELADKAGREELHNTVRAEIDQIESRLLAAKKEVNHRATLDDLGRVEADTALLRSQVTGELTGARWLWRSGKLMTEGWVPWDTEVSNAMPDALVWRPSSPVVLTRPAGLYRLCVAIFTSLPAMVQVCLNGEPIFTLQPETYCDAIDEGSISNAVRDDRYILKRSRHSSGEVTCMSIDEHVSLPANAKLAVRFNAQASAQGFFSIKKL